MAFVCGPPVMIDFTLPVLCGLGFTDERKRITNAHTLPIRVERWRMRHAPVRSAAWITALGKMAEEKAGLMEMDMKNALKRRDLLVVLKGHEAAIRPQKRPAKNEALACIWAN